jgi:23S rRNA (guanosine2251-2'-O)-methyltransferase
MKKVKRGRPPRASKPPPPQQRKAPRNQHGQRTQSGATNPLRDGARWVVGIHSCEETLKVRPKKIREIWLRDDYLSSEQLRRIADEAAKHRIKIEKRSANQLEQIASGHQGVALATNSTPEVQWGELKEDTKQIVLILDGLEDPHNLGSILRTAWLTNVSAIFTPEDRAVGLTPTVNKIASGGAEHVPVEQHTNLAALMKQLKDAGFWIYGLSEKGKQTPWQFELPNKVAWVVGNEGSGMRITTERACDELVRIPQVESGSSYNASIALAMALADTVRQLGEPS